MPPCIWCPTPNPECPKCSSGETCFSSAPTCTNCASAWCAINPNILTSSTLSATPLMLGTVTIISASTTTIAGTTAMMQETVQIGIVITASTAGVTSTYLKSNELHQTTDTMGSTTWSSSAADMTGQTAMSTAGFGTSMLSSTATNPSPSTTTSVASSGDASQSNPSLIGIGVGITLGALAVVILSAALIWTVINRRRRRRGSHCTVYEAGGTRQSWIYQLRGTMSPQELTARGSSAELGEQLSIAELAVRLSRAELCARRSEASLPSSKSEKLV